MTVVGAVKVGNSVMFAGIGSYCFRATSVVGKLVVVGCVIGGEEVLVTEVELAGVVVVVVVEAFGGIVELAFVVTFDEN